MIKYGGCVHWPWKGEPQKGIQAWNHLQVTVRSRLSDLKVTFCAFPFCGSPCAGQWCVCVCVHAHLFAGAGDVTSASSTYVARASTRHRQSLPSVEYLDGCCCYCTGSDVSKATSSKHSRDSDTNRSHTKLVPMPQSAGIKSNTAIVDRVARCCQGRRHLKPECLQQTWVVVLHTFAA